MSARRFPGGLDRTGFDFASNCYGDAGGLSISASADCLERLEQSGSPSGIAAEKRRVQPGDPGSHPDRRLQSALLIFGLPRSAEFNSAIQEAIRIADLQSALLIFGLPRSAEFNSAIQEAIRIADLQSALLIFGLPRSAEFNSAIQKALPVDQCIFRLDNGCR